MFIESGNAHFKKNPRCDQISEALVSLLWLGIEQRIIYKIHFLRLMLFADHSAPVYFV